MIILRADKLHRDIVGKGNLLPEIYHERIIVPVVMNAITFVIFFLTTTAVAVNLYNRDDMSHLSHSLYIFLADLPWFPCYCHLLVNHERFHLLFTDIEDIIHQSKRIVGIFLFLFLRFKPLSMHL